MSVIEVQHLQKHFGQKRVLEDVNLSFASGHIYALLGRNGVGKSTLLSIINNRVLPTAGDVLYDGVSAIENEAAQAHIYLMNDLNYFPSDKRVSWVLKMVGMLYGDFDWQLAAHLQQVFKLDGQAKIRSLSTGQRTIMKLICALCVPVDFVFLDEPVLGLDAPNRELFYQELLQAYGDRPRTFVIATHLIEEIARMIDHVFVLADGRMQVDQDADALLNSARTVTGTPAAVEAAIADQHVLRRQQVGNQLSAIVMDVPQTFQPAAVEVGGVDLQSLFIALTEEQANA